MLSLEAAQMGPHEGIFQCLYFDIGANPFFLFIYALLTKGCIGKIDGSLFHFSDRKLGMCQYRRLQQA